MKNSDSLEELKKKVLSLEAELADARKKLDDKAIELEAHEGLLKLAMDDMRKVYEDLLRNQSQMMQSDKLASIGLLSAGIIHEIKNPLMAIQNAFAAIEADRASIEESLVQKKKESGESGIFESLLEMKELLSQGLACSIHLGKIVKDIRSFSRVDDQKVRLSDLNELFETVLAMARGEIKGKIEVVRNYGVIPSISCNSQQISQVFLNLIVNAAQAIPEQGQIILKTYADEEWVTAEIGDTGTGIPPEILQKIFEPFFTTKDAEKGTGLGLSITKDVIEKHQGKLDVKTQVGKGTTFIIKLPIKK